MKILFLVFSFLIFSSNNKIADKKIASKIDKDFVKLNLDSLGIINAMAYATTNNFAKEKLYPCAECYLRKQVAEALIKINSDAKNQNLKLVIYDCYRPFSIQKKLFKAASNKNYVSSPGKGSKHNKGCAVDISLANNKNEILPMGSAFDEFSKKSHYACATISKQEKQNRKTLRDLMSKHGFKGISNEWWHFNFKQNNYPVSDFQFDCN